ncbi:hypothetical protein EV183_005492, partial [Coemansia sp. RSA 2336]
MVENNKPVDIEFLKTETILNQEWQPVFYFIECNGKYYRSTNEDDMKEVKGILKEDSAASATAYTQLDIPVYSSLYDGAIYVVVTGENTFSWLKDAVVGNYSCKEPSSFVIKYGDELEGKNVDDTKVFALYEPSNE